MTLKDLIKSANDILGLPIDWNNFNNDENYQQLFACARLVVNSLLGLWEVSNTTTVELADYHLEPATMVYGILAEYAFVAGMFNEWKVWQEKFDDGLFKARNEKSRVLPVQ